MAKQKDQKEQQQKQQADIQQAADQKEQAPSQDADAQDTNKSFSHTVGMESLQAQPQAGETADQKEQAPAKDSGDQPDTEEPPAHTVEMETLQPQNREQPPSAGAKTSQTPVGKESAEQTDKEEGKKSSTVELKVVQQKKKEIEDRLKSQGTIRLRPPTGGPRAQGGAEQPKQTTGEPGKAETSPGNAAAEKTETTNIAGSKDTGGAAKRTLKIKAGSSGGKTMKIGAGEKEKGTMKLSADQMAGGSQQAGAGGQFRTAAGTGGPGTMAVIASLISTMAAAVTFVFLLLYFLDLYN